MNTTAISDLPTLVTGAQTGDRQAFATLVHRFQDMAVGYAYALIGDFHLAEDAAQEAFVAAWTELPRLRQPAAFAGWFRRLVFMRCTRFTRGLKNHPIDLDNAIGLAAADTDAAAKMEQDQERRAFFHGLAQLPDEERLVAVLFYIGEHSHLAIADFLDMAPATVNNRLRAARKKLQKGILAMAKNRLRQNAPSSSATFAQQVEALTQPGAMRTERYLYGTEVVDGHDAWALFCACAAGDLARVRTLLDKDAKLVNAQYWYQFPIHMAVRQGHADVVQLLLNSGADPGQSRFCYNSWDKLLAVATDRSHNAVRKILETAMAKRFNYNENFEKIAAAIRQQDPASVKSQLAANPNLGKAADTLGNSGLHWAALTRQVELLDLFIGAGAAIDGRRADGQTPLLVALNGDYWYRHWVNKNPQFKSSEPSAQPVFKALLDRGADYSLAAACATGNRDLVAQILAETPAAAARLDPHGSSPLFYAARSGHRALVQLLLDNGADPNRPETLAPQGGALFAAAAGNHLATAELLLQHGANPNGSSDSSGSCLTIVEAKHPQECAPMQALLRQHGATNPAWNMSDDEMKAHLQDPDSLLDDHNDFVHELLGRNNGELYNLFCQRYPEAVPGLAPTDIWGGNLPSAALLQKLVDHGLDPNRPNWIGRTFLHLCAERDDTAAAQLLIDNGAGLEAIELEHGGTPLGAAARNGKTEMVQFLLAKGADPDAPADSPWATARTWARRHEDQNLLDLLTNT